MASLHISMPDGSEFEYVLGPQTARIGRDAQNEVPLQDGSVSTFHAEIRCEEGKYFVHDLGSTNGIRVNGERVAEAALANGDLVRFGNIRAKFVGEEAAASGSQQAVAASAPAASGSPAPGPQASAAIGALAAGSRALGFGPKPKEKDPEKAALIAATVLVALVCIVAIGLSFAMSAV